MRALKALGNFFFRTPLQFCRWHLRTEQDIRKRISASNCLLKTPGPHFFDFLPDVRLYRKLTGKGLKRRF
jgi:hypothetical protein